MDENYTEYFFDFRCDDEIEDVLRVDKARIMIPPNDQEPC